MEELGYDEKPRNWYYEADTQQPGFVAKTEAEEVLDELTPSGERDIFKSHLERGGVESNRPHEVIVQRVEGASFYREVYKRQIDDLNTGEPSIQDLRDATFLIHVSQGNDSASAHRHDSIEFANIPDYIQTIFKSHDDSDWLGYQESL